MLAKLRTRAGLLAPGLAIALVVAAAATFLSEHYEAPVMLFALLLGMALNFLTETERTRGGIEFSARSLLRIGVALLGLKIGWAQVTALGWPPLLMIVAMVVLTMAISVVLAKLMGFNRCSVSFRAVPPRSAARRRRWRCPPLCRRTRRRSRRRCSP